MKFPFLLGSLISMFLITGLPVQAAGIQTWTAHPTSHVHHYTKSGPQGFSPDQIRTLYNIPSTAEGANHSIAIVDAYDNPFIGQELETFSKQYNLPLINGLPGTTSCTVSQGPHPCFQKIAPSGITTNNGWGLESALDTQWAHAIAPKADILLVEAKNAQISSLMAAIHTAEQSHPTSLSLSWGGSEFPDEAKYLPDFNPVDTFITASSGDNGFGTSFPAVIPSVVSVGGSKLTAGTSYSKELAWSGSGGGLSSYFSENQGTYTKRATPDVAYNADPQTGFSVYTKTQGWAVVGGTSAGAPQWAALLTLAKEHTPALSPKDIRSKLFQIAGVSNTANSFHDITNGSNGNCGAFCQAGKGYDLVTGLGSPSTLNLLHAL
jgi:subtilase family serine protease